MTTHRRPATEWRWPPVLAIGIALALSGSLPSEVPWALRLAVVVVGLVLIVPVLVLNPRRLDRRTRWSRVLSVAQLLLIVADRAGWVAALVGHLSFSLTDSMAFSPTDGMPLSTRATAMMGLQAFIAFVIPALVIAKGVSLLG